MRTVATAGAGTARRAPGSKPVARSTSSAPAIRANGAAGRGGDLLGVGAPVARDEHEHRAPVAVEDERLDDLAELAADGAGGVASAVGRAARELLDAGLGAGLAQERGDALHGLRPGSSPRRKG